MHVFDHVPSGKFVRDIATLIVIACVLALPATAQAATTYQAGPNGPGTRTIQQGLSQQSADLTSELIADRIDDALSDVSDQTIAAVATGNGIAAGSPADGFHFWLSGGSAHLSSSQAGANYSGPLYAFAGGVDHWFANVLLGVAVSYEHVDIHTRFNGGDVRGHGVTLSPYLGWQLGDGFSVDAQVSHASLDYDESHIGARGHTSGDRWDGSVNLNKAFTDGDWNFLTSVGYFGVNEEQDRYVESNGNIVDRSTIYDNQIRVKGRAGYAFATDWGSLVPYASARMEFDVSKSKGLVINTVGTTVDTGDFATTFAAGLAAHVGDHALLEFEFWSKQFQDHYNANGVQAVVHWTF